MYPAQQQQTQVRFQQFPQQAYVTSSAPARSNWLIGFGIAECLISKFLFFWCVWIVNIQKSVFAAYLGIICAVFHILIGYLAMVAGRDAIRYRKCAIATLVLSIIGSSVFASTTIPTFAINFGFNDYDCYACKHVDEYGYTELISCPEICPLLAVAYVPCLLFIVLEAIVTIVLSGLSCCRLCRCCGCHYAGDDNVPTLAFQVFTPSQTPYYHLREDDIQHTLPPTNIYSTNPQNFA